MQDKQKILPVLVQSKALQIIKKNVLRDITYPGYINSKDLLVLKWLVGQVLYAIVSLSQSREGNK
jgi:hypothetical protein